MTTIMLMSSEQKRLFLAVAHAVNSAPEGAGPQRIHAAVAARLRPVPTLGEVAEVLRILEVPAVHWRRGRSPERVLSLMLDVLEGGRADDDPDDDILYDGTDDRY